MSTPHPPPERIEVRGIRTLGTHGVLEHEQALPQPFEIDLDVETDTRDAAATEELQRTVDYSALVDEVVAVVGGPSRLLLETLAQAIAEAVLAHVGVRSVTVAVRKLRPPLAADVATAGVRITRTAAPSPLIAGAASRGGVAGNTPSS